MLKTRALTLVDVKGKPKQLTVENWMKYSDRTGILFTDTQQYTIGCDPYKKPKKPRIMTEKYNRNLRIGQIIATKHLSIGLIASFTKTGNPRCIGYDLEKDEILRYNYTYNKDGQKKGTIPKAYAWTEQNCLIIREAGDVRTELPPNIRI